MLGNVIAAVVGSSIVFFILMSTKIVYEKSKKDGICK